MRFQILILLFLLFFGSCITNKMTTENTTTTTYVYTKSIVDTTTTVKWHYTERVPEQIRYIEKDLAANLDVNYIPDVQFYLMWNFIRKDNDVGIYLYREIGPHIPIYHAFMYDGDTVVYTNIEDSLGMKNFLKTNQFSRQKIRKFNKIVKFIKKDNKTINQRW